MWRLGCCRIRSGTIMAIYTKGKDYIIDLNPFMHKVELYNMAQRVRVDSFETMRILLPLMIHNSIAVIENDPYFRNFKSDAYEELLVELCDDFYLEYGLGYDIDYILTDNNFVSYNLTGDGELVLSIKQLVGIVHEDLDDLLGENDGT